MIQFWLAANAPEKYGAKPTHVTNNIIIGGAEELAAMKTALEARRRELRPGAVIPVESRESD